MAAELDDGEFWLPPQFLTDDDLLNDFRSNLYQTKRNDDFTFGFGNLLGPYSDPSSPVESVMSSTENESDDDDYINGLTRKLARSNIQDTYLPFENKKAAWISGSPQSTLCSVMGGCGFKHGSGLWSPNCPTKVSTPPETNLNETSKFDLLYKAAEEVAKMRIMEENIGIYSRIKRVGVEGHVVSPKQPQVTPAHLRSQNRSSEVYPNQNHLYFQRLQATQFQMLKQQKLTKQHQLGNGFCVQGKNGYQQLVLNGGMNKGLRPREFSTSNQLANQQLPDSGMRALFLGDAGTKRESAGTGVFLPRRSGAPNETRKKPGCSTVLLPDRVVQALNLNIEAIDPQPQVQRKGHGNFTPDYDAGMKYRNNLAMAQQRKNQRPPQVTYQELRLPQEWTY